MNNRYLELLDAGYTLVVANRHLARRLRHEHARRQIGQGKTAWPSPDIFQWQAWLQRRWDDDVQDSAGLLLLNDWQEQVLWQRIINESPGAGALMSVPDVVRRVMDAWRLLQEYRLPVFPADTRLNADARVFRGWADTFRNICSRNDWCDHGSMIDVLAERIGDSIRIALIGFDRVTPQQRHLFAGIEKQGGRVVIPEQKAVTELSHVRVCACADAGEEIRAAANWARRGFETEPNAGIGIVVADLQKRRGEIIRRFEDCFAPGAVADTAPAHPQPFSLSAGQSLSRYPLMDTAFSLLVLGQRALPVEEWGALLRSPWLVGAMEEEQARARLDACLREFGETRVDIATLIDIAERRLEVSQRPRRLLKQLQNARGWLQTRPERARHADWAGYISQLLSRYGWPGDRVPDSGEYQSLESWRDVLDRFVSLQLVDEPLTYGDAVGHLRRIATAMNFQPETGETPIQILGPAGVADMGFDHLWIAGLEEETWPPPVRPNPFIPISLQRYRDLPGATADGVLEESREILSRLVRSACRVVISYPENDKDRVLRASPLLKSYVSDAGEPVNVPVPDYAAEILDSAMLETFRDEQAPPLEAGSKTAGGSALFRDQSACPFRAFARYRLHAGAPEEVDIGLSPRDRGFLLHRLLHFLWRRLQSQAHLCELDEAGELGRLLSSVIDEVVETEQRRHPGIWTERFTKLEKTRLGNILRDWLQQEKRRAPFTFIAGEEARCVAVEGLEVKTRIDRVDQLADGREVIIDYKTGEASVSEWLGERPDDPQLPLYAVTREAEVAAVAFGRLKRGRDFGYRGLAREEGILPATKAFTASHQRKSPVNGEQTDQNWDALLAGWRNVIERLALGFRNGDARVDPKNTRTCRYCDQHPLCRIHERPFHTVEDED